MLLLDLGQFGRHDLESVLFAHYSTTRLRLSRWGAL